MSGEMQATTVAACVILGPALWLLIGVANYAWVRRLRRRSGVWTRSDRAFCLFACVLLMPFGLLATVVDGASRIASWVHAEARSDDPAAW